MVDFLKETCKKSLNDLCLKGSTVYFVSKGSAVYIILKGSTVCAISKGPTVYVILKGSILKMISPSKSVYVPYETDHFETSESKKCY